MLSMFISHELRHKNHPSWNEWWVSFFDIFSFIESLVRELIKSKTKTTTETTELKETKEEKEFVEDNKETNVLYKTASGTAGTMRLSFKIAIGVVAVIGVLILTAVLTGFFPVGSVMSSLGIGSAEITGSVSGISGITGSISGIVGSSSVETFLAPLLGLGHVWVITIFSVLASVSVLGIVLVVVVVAGIYKFIKWLFKKNELDVEIPPDTKEREYINEFVALYKLYNKNIDTSLSIEQITEQLKNMIPIKTFESLFNIEESEEKKIYSLKKQPKKNIRG